MGNEVQPGIAAPRMERAWAELLADCWAVEDGSGGWNGGDVVDIVVQKLESLGFDITHPAVRLATVEHDRETYGDDELLRVALGGESDVRCVRCHEVIGDPEMVAGISREHVLCRECGDPE